MKKVFFSVLVAGTFAFASCSQPAVEEAETTTETTVTEESTTTVVNDSISIETATGMDTTSVPGAIHGAAADSAAATTPAQ